MDVYNKHIENIDDEIIRLLSIRQKYVINMKNFKVLELGGHDIKDSFTCKLDNYIFNYEIRNYDKIHKLFNENLKECEIYEELNLSRLIKYSYITFLYDFCEYGEDNNSDYTCAIDMEILLKFVERVHFGYQVIKKKYMDDLDFYNKLFQSNDSSFILYYLSNYIYQPTYLDTIKDKCNKYDICDVLVCTFYKNVILPYYHEVMLHFCNKIKQNQLLP